MQTYVLIDAVMIEAKAKGVVLSYKRNGKVVKHYVYDGVKIHKGDKLTFNLGGFLPLEDDPESELFEVLDAIREQIDDR